MKEGRNTKKPLLEVVYQSPPSRSARLQPLPLCTVRLIFYRQHDTKAKVHCFCYELFLEV